MGIPDSTAGAGKWLKKDRALPFGNAFAVPRPAESPFCVPGSGWHSACIPDIGPRQSGVVLSDGARPFLLSGFRNSPMGFPHETVSSPPFRRVHGAAAGSDAGRRAQSCESRTRPVSGFAPRLEPGHGGLYRGLLAAAAADAGHPAAPSRRVPRIPLMPAVGTPVPKGLGGGAAAPLGSGSAGSIDACRRAGFCRGDPGPEWREFLPTLASPGGIGYGRAYWTARGQRWIAG